MELLDALQGRRSIRTFLPKQIEWWKLAEILDAARYAPSAGNLQNWNFIIVEDLERKKALAEISIKQYWMTDATLIIIYSKMDMIKQYYGVRGEMLYSIQNCAACIQNMLLRAYDLNLGSCWISAFDEDAVKRILKITGEIRVQAILCVGYTEEKAEIPPRYELRDLCYFEEFGKRKDDSVWPLAKHKAIEKEKDKTKKLFGVSLHLRKKKDGVVRTSQKSK